MKQYPRWFEIVEILIVALGLLAGATLFASCGKMKDRDDKQITVQDGPAEADSASADSSAPSSGGKKSKSERLASKLAQFYDLYADKDGMSREAMSNVMEKLKPHLAEFIAGNSLKPWELVNLLFAFDANHDGKVTPKEMVDGVESRIPTLGLFATRDTKLTEEELRKVICTHFEGASQAACDGLAATLALFDREFAGGNGDGQLQRGEISMAGIIMGALQGVDLTNGLPAPADADAETRLAFEQLNNKISEQMFGRYADTAVTDWRKLSKADLELEWMQLSLKLYLSNKLVETYGSEGAIKFADVRSAVGAWGIPLIDRNDRLKALYDSVALGGDGDGKLGTIELFMLISDLRFAVEVKKSVELTTDKLAHKSYLFNTMLQLYSHSGDNIMLTGPRGPSLADKRIRREYWDDFQSFDSDERGGNGNKSLDPGEIAVGFAYARVVDNVFAFYDKDHNGSLSRKEAEPLFKQAGISDPDAIRIFFADIGLGKDTSRFAMGVKLFFSGKKNIDALAPYDFYTRVEEIMPKLLTSASPRQ